MSIATTYRISGTVAATLAIAALLLQAACPAQFALATSIAETQPLHSGCHDASPAPPEPASPGKRCCNGQHYPEMLLKAVQVETAVVVAPVLQAQSTSVPPLTPVPLTSSPVVSPPGPLLVLRI
jgi:hypothetical protein